MGRLILCYAKKAEKPYLIKNMNLNLYTLEELCYFLHDNLYLVDETIVNETLEKWVIEELGLEQIRKDLELNRGNIKNFIMVILKFTGYMSEEDIEETGRLLSQIASQSDFDKTFGRAKHLLENKRYLEALLAYKKLVLMEEKSKLEKIYNNMGVAYVNLFLYKLAAQCFFNAYEVNQNKEIYQRFVYACSLCTKEEVTHFKDKLPKDYEALFQEVIKNNALTSQNKKLSQLDEILKLKNDNQIAGYYKGLENLLEEWKKEYRNYTG